MIACSNYVINKVLDAPFDRYHPTKCNRPAALGTVNVQAAYVQWVTMMAVGLLMASRVSMMFFITAAALWIMGCIYNIVPLRAKASVITLKPATCGHFKTGHFGWPET